MKMEAESSCTATRYGRPGAARAATVKARSSPKASESFALPNFRKALSLKSAKRVSPCHNLDFKSLASRSEGIRF